MKRILPVLLLTLICVPALAHTKEQQKPMFWSFETIPTVFDQPLDYPFIAEGTLKYGHETIAWSLQFSAARLELSVVINTDVDQDELYDAIPRSTDFAREVVYDSYENAGFYTVLYPAQSVCTMDQINRVDCDFKSLTEAVQRSLTQLGIFKKVVVSRMTPWP